MHNSGIPTTRSLSLVLTEDFAERTILDKKIMEPCAVIGRLSPNFLRFGSFQICYSEDA
jgi:uncharacterized protein YdiU (UPF0061 family)